MVTDRLKSVVDEKVQGVPVNLVEIKKQCEIFSSVSADKLVNCSEISSFAQCIFVKIRHIITEYYQQIFRNSMSFGGNSGPFVANGIGKPFAANPNVNGNNAINNNVDANINSYPATNGNSKAEAKGNANAEINSNTKTDPKTINKGNTTTYGSDNVIEKPEVNNLGNKGA